MSVKKQFQPLVDFLEANRDVKVNKIMDQIIALVSAKSKGVGSTYVKDANGMTVAIFDYYFKRWMPLVGDKAVEFGAKGSNAATGLNVMCKEGLALWTKAQRDAKKASTELLTKVAAGEIKPSEIAAYQAQIEADRKVIQGTTLGFETEEELMSYLQACSVKLAA